MKAFVLSILIGMISLIGIGQNLVLNSSFEEHSVCPNDNDGSLIQQADHWSNPNLYSPDYFNSCDETASQNYSVPDNNYGNQLARTGNAYAGLITVAEDANVREYIQNKLTNPLLAGQMYCVSFYISVSDRSQYASNDIGVYFSNDSIFENTTHYLSFSPQISNDSEENPLVNKILWQEVSGSFVAQGGEQYIIIGNFYSSEITDTTHFENGTLNYSYHYIDDVSVKLCEDNNIYENQEDFDIQIFPNPTDKILNIKCNSSMIYEVSLFSYTGENLIVISKEQSQDIQIDLSNQKKGIYILLIKTNNGIINRKINHY